MSLSASRSHEQLEGGQFPAEALQAGCKRVQVTILGYDIGIRV